MSNPAETVLLPDAGPLITLGYAEALDLLFKPGWSLALVDMVLHEVTRNQTPTSQKIGKWTKENSVPILPTRIHERYQQALIASNTVPRKSNLGELAIQEVMNSFVLASPPRTAVFLFEDHKISRESFLLPDSCYKVSTLAFLIFLEQKGWIESAFEIERRAVRAGREFSRLRFPPE